MEPEERSFVQSKLPLLIEEVNCSKSLLARLRQSGVLSREEEEEINAKPTKTKKAYLLFDIIRTKSGSFKLFSTALQDCKQTGALSILRQYKKPEKPSLFRTSLAKPFFQNYLKNPKHLVIISQDVRLTKNSLLSVIPSIQLNETSKPVSFLNYLTLSGFHGSYRQHKVVIAGKEDRFAIKSASDENCEIVEDKFKWNDLSEDSQSKLLSEGNVQFQEQTISLGDLSSLDAAAPRLSESTILKSLSTSVLIKLLNGEVADIPACSSLLSQPKPYIYRHLRSRNRISRKVLQLTNFSTPDIFVFESVDLRFYEFATFVSKYGNNKCDLSTNHDKCDKNKIKCFLLTNKAHFEDICTTTKRVNENASIHLILAKAENEEVKTLDWKKSVGSIENIQKYVHYEQEVSSGNDFYEKTYDTVENPITIPMCISGPPGMGKSSLLSNLAKKLQTQKPSKSSRHRITFVQRIIMIDFIDKFLQKYRSDKSSDKKVLIIEVKHLMGALCETCPNKFWQTIAKALLSTSSDALKEVFPEKFEIKLELAFDGMEELDSLKSKIAHKIIQKIITEKLFNFPARIWITCLPSQKLATEILLGVFAYDLQPLDSDGQVKLLTGIWKYDNEDETEMEDLAASCIKYFGENFETLELAGSSVDNTGIPMLCTLIARHFTERAIELHQLSETEFTPGSKNVTITDIYTVFMNTRMIQKRQKRNLGQAKSRYKQVGLDIVFPGKFKNLLVCDSDFSDLLEDGILEDRCLPDDEFADGENVRQFRFVHGSFAWFCSAQALIKVLGMLEETSKNPEADRKYFLLVTTLLALDDEKISLSTLPKTPCKISSFKFSYPTLCYFVNSLIPSKLDTKRLVNRYLNLYPDDQENLATILLEVLMASIVANYAKIANPILQALGVIYTDTKNVTLGFEVCLNLEFLSAKHASKSLMERVYEFIYRFREPDKLSYEFEIFERLKTIEERGDFDGPSQLMAALDLDTSDRFFKTWCAEYSKIIYALDLDKADTNDNRLIRLKLVCRQNEVLIWHPNQVVSSATLTPLHIALEAGNTDVIDYLIHEKCMKEAVKNSPMKYRCLLNACIVNTIREDTSTIAKKIVIMQDLAKMCPNIYTDNVITKNLQLEEMHIDLLLEYLKIKEELEFKEAIEQENIAVNQYGENFMHLLARGNYHPDITPQQYHEALKRILQEIPLFKPARVLRHLLARDAFSWRAIDVAISRLDLLDETLKLFKKLHEDLKEAFQLSNRLLKTFFVKSKELIQPEIDLYNELLSEASQDKSDIAAKLDNLKSSKSEQQLSSEEEWISKLDFYRRVHETHWDMRSDFRGSNVFYKAVAGHRSEGFLERLLKSNLVLSDDEPHTQYSGRTVLHVATAYLNIDAVKFAINRNLVRVNAQDKDGNTPLHLCFRLEYVQLANHIFYSDEKQSKESTPDTSIDSSISSVYESALSSMESSASNHECIQEYKIMRSLYAALTQSSNDVDDDDSPPKSPDLRSDVAPVTLGSNWYINQTFDPINTNYAKFQTTLRFYPRSSETDPNNQHKIISLLIENGAKIYKKNNDGITPFHLALTNLCLAGLEKNDIDYLFAPGKNLFSSKCLTLALKGLFLNENLGARCHPSLIASFAKAIQQCGGRIDMTDEFDGASLLHLAAKKHSFYAVKHLITVEGFSAKMPDKFGRSPLEYMGCKRACGKNNCKELRQFLVDKYDEYGNILDILL